ncbi:MAG: hypothetical protein IJF88_04705, partial [Oscillospiraceae bacterium]|nr:hypothetical protein [Oscillospiraceae bacterium]
LHFRRGNVPFVLAATFRARLFLFPVDCSLFPLYYPLLFHQQLDKSEFPCFLYHATAVFYFPIAFLGGVWYTVSR